MKTLFTYRNIIFLFFPLLFAKKTCGAFGSGGDSFGAFSSGSSYWSGGTSYFSGDNSLTQYNNDPRSYPDIRPYELDDTGNHFQHMVNRPLPLYAPLSARRPRQQRERDPIVNQSGPINSYAWVAEWFDPIPVELPSSDTLPLSDSEIDLRMSTELSLASLLGQEALFRSDEFRDYTKGYQTVDVDIPPPNPYEDLYKYRWRIMHMKKKVGIEIYYKNDIANRRFIVKASPNPYENILSSSSKATRLHDVIAGGDLSPFFCPSWWRNRILDGYIRSYAPRGISFPDALADLCQLYCVDGRETTALHWAVRSGNLAKVQWVLNRGHFDINGACKTFFASGIRPIHLACANSSNEILRFLIDQGAEIAHNRRESLRFREECAEVHPIHVAVYFNRQDNVRTLLQQGVDLNQRASYNSTPLHMAVFLDHHAMKDFLVSQNADTTIRDGGQQKPLDSITKKQFQFIQKMKRRWDKHYALRKKGITKFMIPIISSFLAQLRRQEEQKRRKKDCTIL